MALPKVFRGVEDLLPPPDHMVVEPEHDGLPEDIVEMGSPSNEQGSPPMLDLNLPVEVEVFIPMENGVQLQINPDEFPKEELMGVDGEDPVGEAGNLGAC